MLFNPAKLENFPTLPGVYLMKSDKGEVLYVGKAINIRQRVKQYFASNGDGREMIPYLIAKVQAIDTIVVHSEKEALLLENTLIKKYQPKYNALLKDDKSYVALKVTNKHPWPMVQVVRYRGKPKADGLYFGPYPSAYAARQTLDLLQKLFPLRQCSDQEFAKRKRPCLLYDMKRCIAPCVDKCTKEAYRLLVERVIKFLRGQDKEVLRELYSDMEKHAEELEFEKAGKVLEVIRQIESTLETQKVDKPLGQDLDALALFRQAGECVISKLIFRGGKLVGAHQFNFANVVEDDEELFESFLIQHYPTEADLPHEILLPIALRNLSMLSEVLSNDRPRRVIVNFPQRGEKRSLIEMAYLNAETTFKKEKDIQAIREKTLLEMQERFGLSRYPRRIECFDNSNISGSSMVAAMVAFTEGAKDSKRYRKYKIRSTSTSDDYAAMQEVLTRRLQRGQEEGDLPDLLVIDGGKGHLNVALKVLATLNIVNIDVIGLAKEEARHDKGMTAEQVFCPNKQESVSLGKTSPLLFLLQQIRDEAHRFAITFHRKQRGKKTLASAMDNIPGIGPVKRKLLLKHFGSVKQLKEASDADLQAVKGLSAANIEALKTFIRASKD